MSSATAPLLVRWSPDSISVIDPISGRKSEGESLVQLLGDANHGRHAIVAIGQRSVFIRNLQVPALSKDDTARLIALKVGPLIPLEATDYSFGFRLGPESKGQGRTAVVGAVRTTTLRSIYRDCADAGLQVQMVVPIAFGSWMAAHERGLANCAAISIEGRSLNIDLIDNGELCYSRSIALPDSADEIADEIACTFEIAQLPPGPILVLGSSVASIADFIDPKSASEHLLDAGARHQLFTLELPEQVEKRSSNTRRAAAQRALVALFTALILGGLAFRSAAVAATAAHQRITQDASRHDRATAAQATAVDREIAAREQKLVVDLAFRPAQTFSDVLHALNSDTSSGIWLTGLTLERGKPITVSGSAMKQQALSKLVAKLAKDRRFRDMKLSYATRVKIGHQLVIQFAVTGAVVGNLPIDELPKPPGER